jgi:hypothetical protein
MMEGNQASTASSTSRSGSSGKSFGERVRDFVAGALTLGSIAYGVHDATAHPLEPGPGSDQLGHYAEVQHERTANDTFSPGAQAASRGDRWTSQQR